MCVWIALRIKGVQTTNNNPGTPSLRKMKKQSQLQKREMTVKGLFGIQMIGSGKMHSCTTFYERYSSASFRILALSLVDSGSMTRPASKNLGATHGSTTAFVNEAHTNYI